MCSTPRNAKKNDLVDGATVHCTYTYSAGNPGNLRGGLGETASASSPASLTPWESFVRAAFGYSLLDRGNASADVLRTGRFLATSLEPVVGGLEWVPRPYVRRA